VISPHERSRVRWRGSRPAEGLTWGKALSGKPFIDKAEKYGVFSPDRAILEIGPGYGRLLRETVGRGLPFREYVGVDISEQNVEHLRSQFTEPNIRFVLGDVESVRLNTRFDAVVSSLTLKHLYPSFEEALRNVVRHLAPGATLVFDLIEGDSAGFFPPHYLIFVRSYSRAELEGILDATGLELVAFDEVEHDPEHTRLLVVARKP
jgi:SAM-dependent methyltransferase